MTKPGHWRAMMWRWPKLARSILIASFGLVVACGGSDEPEGAPDSGLRGPDGGGSDSGADTTLSGPPEPAPSDFAIGDVTATTAEATWTDNSSNEDEFVLERWDDAASSWLDHATSAADATATTLTGLAPGTEYGMRIRARNSLGDSEVSNEQWFVTETSTGGSCGDGTCDSGETCGGCERDCGACPSGLVFSDDFDYSDDFDAHGWSGGGSDKFHHERSGCRTNGCVRIRYDEGGTGPYWFGVPVQDERMQDFTVRFFFRVDGTPALGGCKFFKVFGASPAGTSGSYANTTIGLNYHSGSIQDVGYGGGSGLENDAQDLIRLNGARVTDEEVSVVTSTSTFVPSEGEWHEFRAYMRYNSDGVRDGEYRVWIDGELRVHAENVRNRNDANLAYPRSIDLANYSSRPQRRHDWDLWYDDIEIYRGLVTP